MGRSKSILTDEVLQKINQYMEQKMHLKADAIAREICAEHQHELIDDAEWSPLVIYSTVRKQVGQAISKMLDRPEEQSAQLVIGFEYLQTYYVVDRDGQALGVPVDECTDDELKFIADRMEKNAETLLKHAKEIKAYVSKRVSLFDQLNMAANG